jgi:sulfur carrier protein ThiS adenylyltransferase
MTERFSRQEDIVPRKRILDCKTTVIGVGAVGRQVSLQLTAIGVPHLQLVDFDIVEVGNLATQGFLQTDLGQLKVEATAEFCRQLNPDVHVEVVPDRFKRSTQVGNCVFCCVDSITARQHIWQVVKETVSFYCDGRMSAEVLRLITAFDDPSRAYYPQTLFSQQEAYVGPCTAKSTIYCANIAAGLMLAQFTKYLRRLPIDPDIQLNLLASEMYLTEVHKTQN